MKPWLTARFPSTDLRSDFLDEVRVWNAVESLPCIETEPVVDARCLRFRTADPRETGVRRYVQSFGAWIEG